MEMNARLEHSLHKKQILHDMKKTVIALLALAGFVQADDTPTYLIKNSDFSYYVDEKGKVTGMLDLQDVVETFNTGTFAISFDLFSVLATDDTGDSFDFKFNYGGGGNSLVFSYKALPYGSVLIAPGNSYQPLDSPINAETLIVQVDDLFGYNPTVTLLGYTEGQELETIWEDRVPSNPPTSIETANLILHGQGENDSPLTGIGLTIWQGKVTAADMANPTPAPSIPEPTTATLSLLALAGLAARRRRRK